MARVSSNSAKLESRPSARYIDMRLSHLDLNSLPDDLRRSISTGSDIDSEGFIEFIFPAGSLNHCCIQERMKEPMVEEPIGQIQEEDEIDSEVDAFPHRNSLDLPPGTRYPQSKPTVPDFSAILKVMRFPKVSQETLRVDIEDFYTSLTVGLDSLGRLADYSFLSAEFLNQSISLLQSMDADVQILMEKLATYRNPRSVEFGQALGEYCRVSAKILQLFEALKFTTTLLKAYQSSHVEAALVAAEAVAALPKGSPRAIHVTKAKEAGRFLDICETEMIQMQCQVKKVVQNRDYGSLLQFVPVLNIPNAAVEFAKWSGIRGVLFAQKAAAAYISQLLLAGLASSGDGPALIASTNLGSFRSQWATSLVNLHSHARRQFNKMKEVNKTSCCFMSQDTTQLQYMLADTKGHLQSLLDQGKFLNMGVYINSWQADKKKLVHNMPLLRRHLLVIRTRLVGHVENLESLASGMEERQRSLEKQFLLIDSRTSGQPSRLPELH